MVAAEKLHGTKKAARRDRGSLWRILGTCQSLGHTSHVYGLVDKRFGFIVCL